MEKNAHMKRTVKFISLILTAALILGTIPAAFDLRDADLDVTAGTEQYKQLGYFERQ